jgi:hypothetical protein
VSALKRNFTGQNDVTVKNANSSLMDMEALATIRVMTERNGTIAKMADINSHLAKTKNSITSGIKNVIASFYAYKKRPFCGLFYVY